MLDNKLVQTKFDGRYVHKGLLEATRWVLDAECEFLWGLVERSQDYTLLFLGHSLEACRHAGVVTFLVFVVQNLDKLRHIEKNKIRCFAIAPTTCMSLNLVVRYANVIKSMYY